VWWPSLRAILRPGGLVIADNAISHADEMRSFIGEVTADSQFTTSVVPVGKGEFLAVKAAA
jgi:predicted O-methyltransferase YrrM